MSRPGTITPSPSQAHSAVGSAGILLCRLTHQWRSLLGPLYRTGQLRRFLLPFVIGSLLWVAYGLGKFNAPCRPATRRTSRSRPIRRCSCWPVYVVIEPWLRATPAARAIRDRFELQPLIELSTYPELDLRLERVTARGFNIELARSDERYQLAYAAAPSSLGDSSDHRQLAVAYEAIRVREVWPQR